MAVVKVVCKNLKKNPPCPHGPTLKFVRVQDGKEQEFYACSAYRDRKDCSFYLAVGDKLTETLQEVWALEKSRLMPRMDHLALQSRYNMVKEEPPEERLYCHTCNELDVVSNQVQHRSHEMLTPLSDTMLAQPSTILKAKEGSKKEAQYFFANSTTKVIVENLKRAGVRRVLCLGTPRVHERIQAAGSDMESLLLDLDHRYHSFWPGDKFVWYNMFNRHVLGEKKGRKALKEWMAVAGLKALVMDPPFGGHVKPLSATVRHFTRLVQPEQLLVVWVFPYFRERHITAKCPSLLMIDYKVIYKNHKKFKKGSKLGSPVRLFTNIPPKQFELPATDGYRLCEECNRWVSKNNKHCVKCGVCPSKDGRTYTHCDDCGCCVKPRWQHCSACQRCLPSPHNCVDQNGSQQSNEIKEPRRKRMKTSKPSKPKPTDGVKPKKSKKKK